MHTATPQESPATTPGGLYFVTVLGRLKPTRRLIETGPRKGEILEREARSQRCWGYLETLAEAEEALIQNVTDMHETIYELAVIERIEAGILGQAVEISWWRFDREARGGTGGYVKAAKPADLESLVHFAF
jgi:hypothetical protein